MHVNDEELSCEYEGNYAEARVSLLRPNGRHGWRVHVRQYIWGEGVSAYYSGDRRDHTYHLLDRKRAVEKFAELSAAMVAVFCAGAR